MVVHAFDLSILQVEADVLEVQENLRYTMRNNLEGGRMWCELFSVFIFFWLILLYVLEK